MVSYEEYEFVPGCEDNLPAVKVDGKFFTTLKSRMLQKFSSQPDPELRVQKLVDNALQIYRKIQFLSTLPDKIDRNLLLVGKVQSGKTSNMQMAVALAFDNGYDALILYGGYDNTLLDQAIVRFSGEAFKKPDGMSDEDALTKWVATFTNRDGRGNPIDALDLDTVESILEDGGKIMMICRKGPSAIGKINSVLERLEDCGLKTLIFDDEGDQASLNNEFRKQGQSATYREIVAMKNILHNPPYLSVTATPQALVFSDDTSRLRPRALQLINPGTGYTGLDEFHLGLTNRCVSVDDEIDDCLSLERPVLPDSLWEAIYAYLATSALLRANHVLDRTQMIIHFDKLTKKHAQVFTILSNYLDGLKKNIKNGQSATFNRKIEAIREVYDNDAIISPTLKNGLSFDDLREDLIKVVKSVHPALMNSQGGDTMAPLPFKKYQIRVGADLLQRGVSFDQLVTTYFTRWPKGTSNMDTQIQRARWLGYRSKYFEYCHVYTTDSIDYSFSRLAEIEDDLWDQMREIESGSKTIEGIMVEADPRMRPSRRSATDYKCQVFGRKWLNQSLGLTLDPIINANNLAVVQFLNGCSFEPVHCGATALDPDRITGYHSYVDFVDFVNLLRNVPSVFSEHPFGGIENIIKASRGKKISVITFFNPEALKTDANISALSDRIRERDFADIDGQCRVNQLKQGADKRKEFAAERKYLGDSYVLFDEEAITLQISAIRPVGKHTPARIDSKTQFMFSFHFPQAIAVFTRGSYDEN